MWQEFMFVVATHLMHDMKTACPAAATALVAFESSPWCVRHLCWWMISWGVALPFNYPSKTLGNIVIHKLGILIHQNFRRKHIGVDLDVFAITPWED